MHPLILGHGNGVPLIGAAHLVAIGDVVDSPQHLPDGSVARSSKGTIIAYSSSGDRTDVM